MKEEPSEYVKAIARLFLSAPEFSRDERFLERAGEIAARRERADFTRVVDEELREKLARGEHFSSEAVFRRKARR